MLGEGTQPPSLPPSEQSGLSLDHTVESPVSFKSRDAPIGSDVAGWGPVIESFKSSPHDSIMRSKGEHHHPRPCCDISRERVLPQKRSLKNTANSLSTVFAYGDNVKTLIYIKHFKTAELTLPNEELGLLWFSQARFVSKTKILNPC